MILPILVRTVSHQRHTARLWRYYWDTIESCVPPEVILGALREAGFSNVERTVQNGILSEYAGTR